MKVSGFGVALSKSYLACIQWLYLGPKWPADFDKLLPSTDIVITTPFWPVYLTEDRLLKAKQLELSLTAGVGSDHVDLHTAAQKGITVAEVIIRRYSRSLQFPKTTLPHVMMPNQASGTRVQCRLYVLTANLVSAIFCQNASTQ